MTVDRSMLPTPHNLTAKQWVERAKETLNKRTKEDDDSELLDAYDDLCNALEVWEEAK
jgi:hypothetical protein